MPIPHPRSRINSFLCTTKLALLSLYVGESERGVACRPATVFLGSRRKLWLGGLNALNIRMTVWKSGTAVQMYVTSYCFKTSHSGYLLADDRKCQEVVTSRPRI